MKKIIRVFPERTSYTPDDNMVYIGLPPRLLPIPDHDEIHVSCTFTWDREYCMDLQKQWEIVTEKPVLLGGVAFGSEIKGFQQGLYVKKNIIFTSRGCNNNCWFCTVPKTEGKLVELPICEGNIIQDNNFLQCSIEHREKVFKMLKNQHCVCFKGGLESRLIDDHFIKSLEDLGIRNVHELYFACDSDQDLDPLYEAVKKVQEIGFDQSKIYCYTLIGGKDADYKTMMKNEARLQKIFQMGAMPRAQLYQHFENKKIEYPKVWTDFAKTWTRPPATKSHMKQIQNIAN